MKSPGPLNWPDSPSEQRASNSEHREEINGLYRVAFNNGSFASLAPMNVCGGGGGGSRLFNTSGGVRLVIIEREFRLFSRRVRSFFFLL